MDAPADGPTLLRAPFRHPKWQKYVDWSLIARSRGARYDWYEQAPLSSVRVTRRSAPAPGERAAANGQRGVAWAVTRACRVQSSRQHGRDDLQRSDLQCRYA